MNRGGFALLFVIVIAAAVELLSLSVLALASHESALIASRSRTSEAERAVDAALNRIARDTLALDSLGVGESRSVIVRDNVSARVQRVAWGVYLVTATQDEGGVAIQRQMVLRRIDLQRAIAEANDAVVTAGFLHKENTILEIATANCSLPIGAPRLPRIMTVSAPRFSVGHPEAVIDSMHAMMPAGYAFAGLRWNEVGDVADIVASGAIHLAPADTAGAPLYQMVYGDGDLVVSGTGVGSLLVNGNLHMTANTVIYGAVVVRGTAVIEDRAGIIGSLRIQGRGVSRIGAGTLTQSRCDVANGLISAPSFATILQRGRRFLPAF
jgi:hypothetical protein